MCSIQMCRKLIIAVVWPSNMYLQAKIHNELDFVSCFPHWHILAMNDGSTITSCRPCVRQAHIYVLMEQGFVPRVTPLFGTSVL